MRGKRKAVAWATLICLLAGLQIPVNAEIATESLPQLDTIIDVTKKVSYEQYLESYEAVYPQGSWEFGSNSIVAASPQVTTNGTAEALDQNETMQSRSPVCLFTEDDTFAEWKVTVETAGFYRLAVRYCGLEGKQLDIETVLYINGSVPFETDLRFLLPRAYANNGKITQDTMGNDVRPDKVEVMEWTQRALQDKDGVYSEPYLFYLNAGENRVRLEMTQADVAVDALVVYNEEIPSYEAYQQSNKADAAKVNEVTADTFKQVEGEDAYRVTHTVLNSTYDRMSAITFPQHPAKLRLNTIGSSSWKMPGQNVLLFPVIPRITGSKN